MSMSDRLDAPEAEAWRPDQPEKGHPNPLMGIVVETGMGDGEYGPYPIYWIRDEDGNEWRWHVYGTVAQKRIAELRPAVGDKLGVKSLGDKPSTNYKGKSYADWKIVLEKPSGDAVGGIDYDAIAKATETEDEPF